VIIEIDATSERKEVIQIVDMLYYHVQTTYRTKLIVYSNKEDSKRCIKIVLLNASLYPLIRYQIECIMNCN